MTNDIREKKNEEQIATTIRIFGGNVISNHIPEITWSFASQLKIYVFVTSHLVEQCIISKRIFQLTE